GNAVADVRAGATVAGFTATCANGGLVLTANGTSIRNNTLTGVSGGETIVVTNSSTNHVISLNNITGNYGGVWYSSSTAGGKFENNTVSGNQYGLFIYAPPGDLGNSTTPTSSVGNNLISCN